MWIRCRLASRRRRLRFCLRGRGERRHGSLRRKVRCVGDHRHDRHRCWRNDRRCVRYRYRYRYRYRHRYRHRGGDQRGSDRHNMLRAQWDRIANESGNVQCRDPSSCESQACVVAAAAQGQTFSFEEFEGDGEIEAVTTTFSVAANGAVQIRDYGPADLCFRDKADLYSPVDADALQACEDFECVRAVVVGTSYLETCWDQGYCKQASSTRQRMSSADSVARDASNRVRAR